MSHHFCFFLLPGFSMMGLMSAIEPLRVANRFHAHYSWRLLSDDGQAVPASNGMSLNVDDALDDELADASLFVVAGFDPLATFSPQLASRLRRADRECRVLGGIDTGSFVLAEAGLLETRQRFTLHWEALDAFRERYPQLQPTQELFEIDGRRITSAGGTSSLDLMLGLIGRDHGEPLSIQVSEQFVLGRIRTRLDHQRMQVSSRYGIHDKKLALVIAEMERCTEEPRSPGQLADTVGITTRQLERLFRQHLNTTPITFYLGLRLDKARHLLRQSDLSVLEVALACGFESASYFARRYRTRFAVSPRQDRHETAPPTLRP
ncbi:MULTISPECIES: GlxA family transcriptional regulator [Pseudomonas]|uniref:AraC family transcriptional regulator n=2 Tax=Pseudomonadaceae TaxID=135621 RepID=A0A0D0JWJ2_9PSED|nr:MULTISPECIES: GlxA family transcriptional regulator [Pseudomonas]KIP99997.1 AraC family transcriptional regulator [Pseudomonas fulva]MCW2290156.1 AraC family carnitine catabolism transcriptional activator [Pseudomonas sp. BIGb0408]NYH75271.1 AraC family carnitine catabolism transcriptional activator [Pseudomonas flavescens]